MKPSWNDAPSWAQWIAKDKDGEWRAFENEPIPDEGECYHRPNGGKHQVIVHWTVSKEKRP